MLVTALRMVSVLNALDAHLVTAPEAEHDLTRDEELHHVVDDDGILGTASDEALSLRVALGRVAHSGRPGGWALAPCGPGRPRGLRGPRPLTRRLMAEGAVVVVHHQGGVLWEPRLLSVDGGRAVQWWIRGADQPSLVLTPAEASAELSRTVLDASDRLESLALTAGRPGTGVSVRLGAAYPPSSQLLLDRALGLLVHLGPAREASPEVLHSHGTLLREDVLRRVEDAALDAVAAAASWPEHLMT